MFHVFSRFRNLIPPGLVVCALAAYWLLPIQGQLVLSAPGVGAFDGGPIQLDPADPKPGEKVVMTFTDSMPWSYVAATVTAGKPEYLGVQQDASGQRWSWRWSFIAPDLPGYRIAFYHDC